MTKTEANLAIATALEKRPFFDMPPYPEDGELLTSNEGFWTCINSEGHLPIPVDFFTDENASAMLLEAMRCPLLVSDWPGCKGWRVDIGVEYSGGPLKGPTHTDRKTAIALAAMRWLEIYGTIEG